jgi:hypothetical protein
MRNSPPSPYWPDADPTPQRRYQARKQARQRRQYELDVLYNRLLGAEEDLREAQRWAREHPDNEHNESRVKSRRKALDAVEREVGVVMARERGRLIREERHKAARALAEKIRQLREDEANERLPVEFRAMVREQRLAAERAYHFADDRARGAIEQWKAEQVREAQALYHSDPQGDAASETHALRRSMEVSALAQRYASAGEVSVRNHLVAEGHRLVATGAFDKAQIYHEAATRLGVEDPRLAQQINAHLDRTVPHRRQAREQMLAIESEAVAFRLDVVRDRLLHGIGNSSDAARDSTLLKVSEWKWERENQALREQGVEPPDTTLSA